MAITHFHCIPMIISRCEVGVMNDGDIKGTMPPLVVRSGSTWVQTTSMQG